MRDAIPTNNILLPVRGPKLFVSLTRKTH